MDIQQVPSPNFSSRKGYTPKAVVIHIMAGTLTGTDSWFANPASQVSAHYGIGKAGAVHQYVDEKNAAWHAGRVSTPTWKGIIQSGSSYVNPNYYTVGIEHEGDENSDWPPEMYAASAAMVRSICDRYSLPLDRDHVIGHHEIYGVKTCPGYKVDLDLLISMAAGTAAPAAPDKMPIITSLAGTAVTTGNLNVRPQPDRRYAASATVPSNIPIAFTGYTDSGENVSGNSKWYTTVNGLWFWSGAVRIV